MPQIGELGASVVGPGSLVDFKFSSLDWLPRFLLKGSANQLVMWLSQATSSVVTELHEPPALGKVAALQAEKLPTDKDEAQASVLLRRISLGFGFERFGAFRCSGVRFRVWSLAPCCRDCFEFRRTAEPKQMAALDS